MSQDSVESTPNIDWGKVAISSKNWEWVPGMLTLDYFIPPYNSIGSIRIHHIKIIEGITVLYADSCEDEFLAVCSDQVRPNLQDPATVGCVEYLVGKLYDDPDIFVSNLGDTELLCYIDKYGKEGPIPEDAPHGWYVVQINDGMWVDVWIGLLKHDGLWIPTEPTNIMLSYVTLYTPLSIPT